MMRHRVQKYEMSCAFGTLCEDLGKAMMVAHMVMVLFYLIEVGRCNKTLGLLELNNRRREKRKKQCCRVDCVAQPLISGDFNLWQCERLRLFMVLRRCCSKYEVVICQKGKKKKGCITELWNRNQINKERKTGLYCREQLGKYTNHHSVHTDYRKASLHLFIYDDQCR